MTMPFAFTVGQALACFVIGQSLRRARNPRLRRPKMSDIETLAQVLPSWRNAHLFDFFVVGSMISSPNSARDLDLVLRPRSTHRPTIGQVAMMLLSIELYGLYRLNLPVDTSYRTISEEELLAHIRKGFPFRTIKLHAAKWDKLAVQCPQQVRDIGWGLKEIHRTFEQTSFADKAMAGGVRGRRKPFPDAKLLEEFEPKRRQGVRSGADHNFTVGQK